jgi:hypothetical protein
MMARRIMAGAVVVITFCYCLNDSSCLVLSFFYVYVFVPIFACAYFIIGLQAVGLAQK